MEEMMRKKEMDTEQRTTREEEIVFRTKKEAVVQSCFSDRCLSLFQE